MAKKHTDYYFFPERVLIVFLLFIYILSLVIFNFLNISDHPFSRYFPALSEAFISGHFDFLQESFSIPLNEVQDTALWQGLYYWPLGPLPAVLILPIIFLFKIFGVLFLAHGYFQPFLAAGILYLVFRISRVLGYSIKDTFYFLLAFAVGSPFLSASLIPFGWQFSALVSVIFVLASIYEYLTSKRYWVIGLLMGCVLATRINVGAGIIFFLLSILLDSNLSKILRLKQAVVLSATFLLFVFGILAYNYSRFGSFLETGYSYQMFYDAPIGALRTETKNQYGLFNIKYLPFQAYNFFVRSPLPLESEKQPIIFKFPFIHNNPWGAGLFFTSPYLMSLFFFKYKDRFSKLIILSTAAILLPVLFSNFFDYSNGSLRYSLDFFPFLFFLFMYNYRRQRSEFLSPGMRFTILFASLANFYLTFISV